MDKHTCGYDIESAPKDREIIALCLEMTALYKDNQVIAKEKYGFALIKWHNGGSMYPGKDYASLYIFDAGWYHSAVDDWLVVYDYQCMVAYPLRWMYIPNT